MTEAKYIALLAAPPLILGTGYVAFRQLVAHFGFKLGYLSSFLFYWIVWCLLLPWWVLGAGGMFQLFREGSSRFGQPAAVGLILLVLPCVLGYGYAFPRAIRHADVLIVVLSAALALTNGTLEELLWRGTYLKAFSGSWLLGYVYPSIGFAAWHFAPQTVAPNRAPGGSLSFVIVAGLAGLMWGWTARSSSSILWPAIFHVLFDFSGLGARIYFSAPSRPQDA
jgi:membrane protease YdiL (CAAX protease family)